MKYSFIIGTLNRKNSLEICLTSLLNQTEQDFEIVIIDQSDDDITEKYLSGLNNEKIIYKHVDYKGLSRARNDALKLISGDYFCLVDDDAYYDSNYLMEANKHIDDKRILSGQIWNTNTNSQFVNYKLLTPGKKITLNNIINVCPSAALIFPSRSICDVGYFDENFGVGAKYGSGEETDYLLRLLKFGYSVFYYDLMKVKHPVPANNVEINNKKIIQKAIDYAYGNGALFRKQISIEKNYGVKKIYYIKSIKFVIKKLLHYPNAKIEYHSFKLGFSQYTANR